MIADHIRACTFSVADGIVPGNEGRAYVLRRICRRAIRHGYKLGARKPFFYKLVDAVRAEMAEAYPEINNPRIEKVIEEEERRFLSSRSPRAWKSSTPPLPAPRTACLTGEVVFKLHDTYGFPADLTGDVCRERDVKIDFDGFDAAMARQREAARAKRQSSRWPPASNTRAPTRSSPATKRSKRTKPRFSPSTRTGRPSNSPKRATTASSSSTAPRSMPNRAARSATAANCRNDASLAGVLDTIRVKGKVTGHSCHVEEGRIAVGDKFRLTVDADRRHATQRNHSATRPSPAGPA